MFLNVFVATDFGESLSLYTTSSQDRICINREFSFVSAFAILRVISSPDDPGINTKLSCFSSLGAWLFLKLIVYHHILNFDSNCGGGSLHIVNWVSIQGPSYFFSGSYSLINPNCEYFLFLVQLYIGDRMSVLSLPFFLLFVATRRNALFVPFNCNSLSLINLLHLVMNLLTL